MKLLFSSNHKSHPTTKKCNLLCDIAAKRVEERCWEFLHPRKQTYPASTQVVESCEKVSQKLARSSTFCSKICICCAFYVYGLDGINLPRLPLSAPL